MGHNYSRFHNINPHKFSLAYLTNLQNIMTCSIIQDLSGKYHLESLIKTKNSIKTKFLAFIYPKKDYFLSLLYKIKFKLTKNQIKVERSFFSCLSKCGETKFLEDRNFDDNVLLQFMIL